MWSKDKLFLNLGKEDPLSSLNADSALSHSDVHLETVSVEVHLLHSFCESDRNWNLRLFLVFNTTIAGNSPARRILPSAFLFRGENYSHIKEPQIRNKSNKLTQKHFDWKLSLVLLLSVSSNQECTTPMPASSICLLELYPSSADGSTFKHQYNKKGKTEIFHQVLLGSKAIWLSYSHSANKLKILYNSVVIKGSVWG